jgi:hypothetical protein
MVWAWIASPPGASWPSILHQPIGLLAAEQVQAAIDAREICRSGLLVRSDHWRRKRSRYFRRLEARALARPCGGRSWRWRGVSRVWSPAMIEAGSGHLPRRGSSQLRAMAPAGLLGACRASSRAPQGPTGSQGPEAAAAGRPTSANRLASGRWVHKGWSSGQPSGQRWTSARTKRANRLSTSPCGGVPSRGVVDPMSP